MADRLTVEQVLEMMNNDNDEVGKDSEDEEDEYKVDDTDMSDANESDIMRDEDYDKDFGGAGLNTKDPKSSKSESSKYDKTRSEKPKYS